MVWEGKGRIGVVAKSSSSFPPKSSQILFLFFFIFFFSFWFTLLTQEVRGGWGVGRRFFPSFFGEEI